jgi:PAS domain S-box-containing protein
LLFSWTLAAALPINNALRLAAGNIDVKRPVIMVMRYPYIDVAVMDGVRDRLLDGDAVVLADHTLATVIWANWRGAKLFGASDVESFLDQPLVLSAVEKRQIQSAGQSAAPRDVHVRLQRGLSSRVLRLRIASVTMPGGEQALAISASVAEKDSSNAIYHDIVAGFGSDTAHLAVVTGDGQIVAVSPGYTEARIADDDIARLASEATNEDDRLVKRRVKTANADMPAAAAWLGGADDAVLVMVIDTGTSRDEPLAAPALAPAEPGDPAMVDSVAAIPDPAVGEVHDHPQAPSPDREDQLYLGTSSRLARGDLERTAAKPSSGNDNLGEPVLTTPVSAATGPGSELDPAVAASDGTLVSDGAEAETPASAALASSFVHDPAAGPVRFVWKTGTAGQFLDLSPDFAKAVGPNSADVVGRSFADVARDYDLDPDGDIMGLLQRRDTWSGRSVLWPVEGTDLRVPIDLAALPVYDRDREFQGFRGFGVARMGDVMRDPDGRGLLIGKQPTAEDAAVAAPEETREPAPADPAVQEDDPFKGEPPALTQTPVQPAGVSRGATVVDITARWRQRGDPALPTGEQGGLSATEADTFRLIGQKLREDTTDPVGDVRADGLADQGNDAITDKTESPESVVDGWGAWDAAERSVDPVEKLNVTPRQDSGEERDTDDVVDANDPALLQASSEAPQLTAQSIGEANDGWDVAPTAVSPDSRAVFNARTLVPDAEPIALEPGRTVIPDAEPVAFQTPALAPVDLMVATAEPVAFTDDLPALDDWGTGTEPLAALDGETALAARSVFADAEPVGFETRTTAPVRPKVADAEPVAFTDDLSELDGYDTETEELAALDGVASVADLAAISAEEGTHSALPDQFDDDLDDDFGSRREKQGIDEDALAQLPLALLVHAGDRLHFANNAFFDLTGHASLDTLVAAGGLDSLFPEGADEASGKMHLRRADGSRVAASAHLQSVLWRGSNALLLSLKPEAGQDARIAAGAPILATKSEGDPAAEDLASLRELHAILDTATDGIVLLDRDGNIRSLNASAEALFGHATGAVKGQPFTNLFAMESHREAQLYLNSLSGSGVPAVMHDGRELIAKEAQGRFVPVFMTIGKLAETSGYCLVLRDITNFKRTEQEMLRARRDAEHASEQKSAFLARVSHEVRTPLNAIVGFSELMLSEVYGPVGNQRYRDYMRDINTSGTHVLQLINDLLDISKIEAGELDLEYEAVALNDLVEECVSIMYPAANRERVIVRASLGSPLPDIVADPRSMRQIILNLLSNAIRFTPAGGQIIVSTMFEPTGDVTMKVRDTGIGMSSAELDQALKPFKQVPAARKHRSDGTGLGLPLTKAMAEANRAEFAIRSKPGEGTVAMITFPPTRVSTE